MRHHGGMAGALIIPATVGSTDGATEGAHEFKAYRQACIMSSQRLWAMRLWMTRKMICSSLRAFYHFVSIPIWIPLACAPPNATFLSVLVKFPELDRRVCFRRFCFAFWNSCSFHHGGVFLNHVLNLGLVVLCALIFCVIGV